MQVRAFERYIPLISLKRRFSFPKNQYLTYVVLNF